MRGITYLVYVVHIIIVSSMINKSRNPRAHCTCTLRVVMAKGYLRIIPEFLPIILALFSNSQTYLLCSKLCWHNVSMLTEGTTVGAGREGKVNLYIHVCITEGIHNHSTHFLLHSPHSTQLSHHTHITHTITHCHTSSRQGPTHMYMLLPATGLPPLPHTQGDTVSTKHCAL